MAATNLNVVSQTVEEMLDTGGNHNLDGFLAEESRRRIESQRGSPADYEIFLVRKSGTAGPEIFGPRIIPGGTYSAEELYGAAGSPLRHFRSTVRALLVRAKEAGAASADSIERAHQVALLWADVGRLNEFMGASMAISEIVAELRGARFQFLGKDTPESVLSALHAALELVAQAKRLDEGVVDRVVDTLEAGGIDSLAPDALRDGDA
ncbi:MAG: hypothetical protein AB7O66_15755 [Limisphaerales bacterium]